MKHYKTDLGKWSVKKINVVNVKKILLFECGTNTEPIQQYQIRTSFRIFREERLFLAKVSKS